MRFKTYCIIGVLLLGGVIYAGSQAWFPASTKKDLLPDRANISISLRSSVEIAGVAIPVELATSSSAITKGLSGRASLGQDEGMLFVFLQPSRYRFWLPDMHFPIDIIWIQSNKVIDIDSNVSNKFNPVDPDFYTPSSPVQYVLEVNAGFAKRYNITVGDMVLFNHIK